MARRLVQVVQLGRMRYDPALATQHRYAQRHLDYLAGKSAEPGQNTLLIVEHEPVYTVGIRTKGYTEKDRERLISLSAEFCKTDRGGLITFHGPGQLVVYPILNLKHFGIGMRKYVCQLERSVIETCKHYGITTCTTSDTGVWVNDKKICAVGLHGRRFITRHGIALNCSTDLGWFDHIVPCGIEGKGVTSLTSEVGQTVTIQEALTPFLKCFTQEFDCDISFKK